MTGKGKATAPFSSVGADGKQPLSNYNKESIADMPQKGNLKATNNCGKGGNALELLRVKYFLWCVGRECGMLLYMAVKEKARLGCNDKSGLHSQALGD